MKIFTFHTIAGLLAIGLALGVNFAQAQSGAKSALVVTSISLTPTAASVTVGKTLQFKVTAGFNNGSMKIVTTSATWSSSASKIASIGSAGQPSPGLAKGVAPGNVNITASFSGVSAVTTLNVTGTGATLSSFFISQINPSIAPGAKLQLFGYAEFSDGSTNWVTSTTNWTSSNPSVAAIQNQGQTAPGLVSAAAGTGTTTVTANFEGLTPSTTVRVVANAVPIALTNMTASDHDAAGKAAGAAIQPLDQDGNPSATGAVVFLGIGMSNATEEFQRLSSRGRDELGREPQDAGN